MSHKTKCAGCGKEIILLKDSTEGLTVEELIIKEDEK